MARREYRGNAARLTLDDAVDATALTLQTTGDVSGWPTGAANPFYVMLDRGVAGKAEKVLVTSRSGNTLFLASISQRGADGTTAVAHDEGAHVEHVVDAGTLDEANAHVNDTTRDDHPQYLNTTRHDVTTRHQGGTSIPVGSPVQSLPGHTSSDGVSTSLARADHRHSREAYGTTATTVTPGDAAAAGAATSISRSDHKHAMAGFAAPSFTLPFGGTAAEGNDATYARSDHEHAITSVFGLAQDVQTDNADSAPVAAGAAITLQTVSKTIAAQRIFIIQAQFEVRGAANGAFAGFGYIKENGSTIFGASRRFHSYSAAGVVGGPVFVSFFTIGTRAAGSYTFTLTADNDSGGPNILFSCRNLEVYTLGG